MRQEKPLSTQSAWHAYMCVCVFVCSALIRYQRNSSEWHTLSLWHLSHSPSGPLCRHNMHDSLTLDAVAGIGVASAAATVNFCVLFPFKARGLAYNGFLCAFNAYLWHEIIQSWSEWIAEDITHTAPRHLNNITESTLFLALVFLLLSRVWSTPKGVHICGRWAAIFFLLFFPRFQCFFSIARALRSHVFITIIICVLNVSDTFESTRLIYAASEPNAIHAYYALNAVIHGKAAWIWICRKWLWCNAQHSLQSYFWVLFHPDAETQSCQTHSRIQLKTCMCVQELVLALRFTSSSRFWLRCCSHVCLHWNSNIEDERPSAVLLLSAWR